MKPKRHTNLFIFTQTSMSKAGRRTHGDSAENPINIQRYNILDAAVVVHQTHSYDADDEKSCVSLLPTRRRNVSKMKPINFGVKNDKNQSHSSADSSTDDVAVISNKRNKYK